MRTSTKTLHFPLAGLDCSRSYGVATEPSENRVYATPLAVNVRGVSVFNGRYRGGSRPGLGSVVTTDSVEVFDKPTAYFRGRKIYAEGKLWYASRAGEIADFDVSGDGEDPLRPVIDKVGFASLDDAEEITAIFCVNSDELIIATKKSMWAFRGDVTSGPMSLVSEFVGVVSKDAWAYDGLLYYIVSANGIYTYAAGQGVVRISDNVPEELDGITSAICAYDSEFRALHIFTDKGDWFYDIAAKAWWPQKFHEEHRPRATRVISTASGYKVGFLGGDGKWRAFDKELTDDDGKAFVSYVAIGPIRTGVGNDKDGMLDRLTTTLAQITQDVYCDIYAGKTAEESVLAAKNDKTVRSLALSEGMNGHFLLRCRGAWVTLVLRSDLPWAFESMTAVVKSLGGLR